jgi:serine/threonine protein kinase
MFGAYEILSTIGAGGMGEVYKARDGRLNRLVAIKVLREHLALDADARRGFEHEARTVASLNHPHICTLYDIGKQDGLEYLVMEYLEGQTLAQRLEEGALPEAEAIKVAVDIADALAKVHQHGVVHRGSEARQYHPDEFRSEAVGFRVGKRATSREYRLYGFRPRRKTRKR